MMRSINGSNHASRAAPGVANADPDDRRALAAADGDHVGKVFVLRHDHRFLLERVPPDVLIGCVSRTYLCDVLGLVIELAQ
jgi:hypothetical protein